MKTTLILAVIMCSAYFPAQAQKSPYAPRPVGTAQVLPQYESADNRFGEASTQAPPKPTDANTLEDADLVDRVKEWPKEKQPFWFVNSKPISDNRGQVVPCSGPNCPPVPQANPSSTFVSSNKTN